MRKRGPNVGESGPRVDRDLLRQFTVIAQPYFYPIDAGGAGWGVLMLALLAGVVGCAFWLGAIAIWVLLACMPPESAPAAYTTTNTTTFLDTNTTNTTKTTAATASASASALGLQKLMFSQPWPSVTLACLALVAVLAFTHRKQLRGRWNRWATLALLLLLLLCVTCLMVLMSYAWRQINNTLHKFNEEGFYEAVIFSYGGILLVAVPVFGLYKYTRLKLARHWRAFLCEFFLHRYLSHQAYYQLDSNSADT